MLFTDKLQSDWTKPLVSSSKLEMLFDFSEKQNCCTHNKYDLITTPIHIYWDGFVPALCLNHRWTIILWQCTVSAFVVLISSLVDYSVKWNCNSEIIHHTWFDLICHISVVIDINLRSVYNVTPHAFYAAIVIPGRCLMANTGQSWFLIALQLAPTGANRLQYFEVTIGESHRKMGSPAEFYKFHKVTTNTGSCSVAIIHCSGENSL